MADPDTFVYYSEDQFGVSIPLHAAEALEVPLPSMLHPIQRIRQIGKYVEEFVTFGALESAAPRAWSRMKLAHLAFINEIDMNTHNLNLETANIRDDIKRIRGEK